LLAPEKEAGLSFNHPFSIAMSCEFYGVYFFNAQNLEKPKESLSMMGFGIWEYQRYLCLGPFHVGCSYFSRKKQMET